MAIFWIVAVSNLLVLSWANPPSLNHHNAGAGTTPPILNPKPPKKDGDSGRIRTPDPLLRRQLLYPAELRSQTKDKPDHGADEGIRTPDLRITNALLYRLSYIGTAHERCSYTKRLWG